MLRLFFMASLLMLLRTNAAAQQYQELPPCSTMTAKAVSSTGVPFNKQKPSEQAEHLLIVTKDFNNRLLVTLMRLSTVHSRAEFDRLDAWSRNHDDICLDDWTRLNYYARSHGVLSKAYMTPSLSRELSLEDGLWQKITTQAMRWHPDLLENTEP